jgi:hypothetical protein
MWGSCRAAHRLQEAVDNFGSTAGEIIALRTFLCVVRRGPV